MGNYIQEKCTCSIPQTTTTTPLLKKEVQYGNQIDYGSKPVLLDKSTPDGSFQDIHYAYHRKKSL